MSFKKYIKDLFSKRPAIHNGYPVLAAVSRIHDRGVFAASEFRKGDWIEIAPFIPVSSEQFSLLKGTSLHYSYFMTGREDFPAVIGLGLASLYNHGSPAHASYNIDMEQQVIRFRATRQIKAGEEITINYNGAPDDQTPVRFNDQP